MADLIIMIIKSIKSEYEASSCSKNSMREVLYPNKIQIKLT